VKRQEGASVRELGSVNPLLCSDYARHPPRGSQANRGVGGEARHHADEAGLGELAKRVKERLLADGPDKIDPAVTDTWDKLFAAFQPAGTAASAAA
jgi:hypothetical protein